MLLGVVTAHYGVEGDGFCGFPLGVVPLVLVGFDATEDLRRSKTSPWVQRYKWPILFFVAVVA